MTIITIDTETQGLNTHNWIMGCVTHEDGSTQSFRNRNSMQAYIEKLLERHRKQKKTLFVYAHNMQYDYLVLYGAQPRQDHTIYCHSPFIVDVRDDTDEKTRIYGKFLSTTSLYRGPLSGMGEALCKEKSETPVWLKEQQYTPSFIELNQAQQYMERDSEIVMLYVQTLKKYLKDYGITIRWLITSGQVGINALRQHLQNHPQRDEFFKNTWKREFHTTHYAKQIKQGLRGGRVQAFKTGTFHNVSNIDINSHYPHCFAHMRMPALRTEQYIEKPLEYHDREALLDNIGVSHCKITVKKNKFGILPIRNSDHETVYPNESGQILIGVWSHLELREAIKRGYILEHVSWSIVYQETTNPFESYMYTMATKRLESNNTMERDFLKMVMNAGLGKFCQERPDRIGCWKHIGEHDDMLDDGYEVLEESGFYRYYSKTLGINYPTWYAPILYTQLTATARIKLLELMELFEPDEVYYCDTDGVLVNSVALKKKNFKYSKDLGGLKLDSDDESLTLFGKKTYSLGEKVKLSGVSRAFSTMDAFSKGIIEYPKMNTHGNCPDIHLIGTFTWHTRNLSETLEKYQATEYKTNSTHVFVDAYSTVEYSYEGQ